MNWVSVERLLRRRGIRLFTPLELRRLLGVSAVAARFLVHRYSRRGLFVKLRGGLYALAEPPPSELEAANRLVEPSYLSLEFALSFHRLIPEAAYTLTSVTPRPTRTLSAMGRRFEYRRIKRSAFSGYELVRTGGGSVLMATPEKAWVDTLYFVALKKKTLPDRLDLRGLSRRRIEAYVRLFDYPPLRALERKIR